ncbi:hypothetical protein OHS33_32235 [Streptomyces sp. NBC_00536]|uniref:hypothetical protein n=1 Tax=Streptomyces sp. NBC_00536 TaxID=2975769 RepID=UPI002E7FBDBD|nr:hypothetical protein [Streptomyces sp. NBC_00536]WUC82620.1 hypothetical protein OHS33_32235 [Streptomyces sp. NBC_00536]
MSIHHTIRAAIGPVLLLAGAAAAAAGAAGTAQAAGKEFQYIGQDDKPHAVPAHAGCHAAVGGGSRGVVNKTGMRVALYREPGCKGEPAAYVLPGTSAPVTVYFASVRLSG